MDTIIVPGGGQITEVLEHNTLSKEVNILARQVLHEPWSVGFSTPILNAISPDLTHTYSGNQHVINIPTHIQIKHSDPEVITDATPYLLHEKMCIYLPVFSASVAEKYGAEYSLAERPRDFYIDEAGAISKEAVAEMLLAHMFVMDEIIKCGYEKKLVEYLINFQNNLTFIYDIQDRASGLDIQDHVYLLAIRMMINRYNTIYNGDITTDGMDQLHDLNMRTLMKMGVNGIRENTDDKDASDKVIFSMKSKTMLKVLGFIINGSNVLPLTDSKASNSVVLEEYKNELLKAFN